MSFAFVATARKNSSVSSASKPAIETGGRSASNRHSGRPEMSIAHIRERLVHRHRRVAVAADPGAVAERLVERLAERDADVLDRVVGAGLEVAGRLDHAGRAGRGGRAARACGRGSRPRSTAVDLAAVEVERDADLGLARSCARSRVRLIGFESPATGSSRISPRASPTRRARESPRRAASAPTCGRERSRGRPGMVTTEVRRRKVPGPSGPPKRAAPPVGSTWLEPAA